MVLTLAARCWNLRDVFVEGHIYFLDADCYSRMTRARMVAEGQGTVVVRHHDFENWPRGTTPHTTAPMDWLIAGLASASNLVFRISDFGKRSLLSAQTLDFAGAIISPLLGTLACAFLGVWAWRQRMSGWLAVPLFFAISPVLVHGTLLGRPDHQSLLILLVAVAVTAELALARAITQGWSIVAGVAWALALWVSLYEPLVLLMAASGVWCFCDRRRFVAREARAGWIAFGAFLLGAWWIDGWRVTWPDAAMRGAFLSWQKTVGELTHLDPRGPLLYRWLGAAIVIAPLVLLGTVIFERRRGDATRATAPLLVLVLLAATFALTMWQLRWGYFLAIVFALSLPWMFAAAHRWWIAWPLFALTLGPLARDWDEKLYPEDHPERDIETRRAVLRVEAVRLREVADAMRGPERAPFIAPWWLSPALAYWSGQPGVAGSSHESLPGIVATARFFLAPNAAEAERIARELGARWIVTDDPERLVATSRALLDRRGESETPFVVHLHEVAEPRERVSPGDVRAATPEARARLIELAEQAEAAQLGTTAFSCVSSNQFYKLFSVKPASPK